MKEKNFILLRVIVLGTLGLMTSSLGQVQAQNIIYVDVVTSGGDGTSWTTAFNDLQDALDIAAAGDEIWVAAGTYIPSKEKVPGTPRSVTFNLISGVGIYGGFPPDGGPWESRNPESYVTTLSGDIGVVNSSADNAYNVVYAYLTYSATVLDGLTVMGGNGGLSYGYGGGIYIHGGSPLVSNCVIRNNQANILGGGIYCRNGSSAVITDCIVTENHAGNDGGGICCLDSSAVTISNCLITDNSSTGTEGGGISCKYSSITISNCMVANNTAPYGGGGIECYESNPTIINCLFTGNSATAVWYGGGAAGGAIGCWFSSPTIRNCTITGNSAPGKAGGIWLTNGSHVTLTNTILWGNIAESWYGQELAIKAMYPGGNSSATVKYSNVEGGKDAVFLEDYLSYIAILNWDDVSNFDADPLFVSGPLGDYLLSQVVAGNPNDSPCCDTGSDLASTLNLDTLTTRTDSFPDTGQVDMGYHYGITNQPPEATITNPISGLVQPVNDPIAFEALISDPDVGDTHTAIWTITTENWTEDYPGTVNVNVVSDLFTFYEAGIYNITLTVTDSSGASTTVNTVYDLPSFVVIYDPEGGFVTGGGWIYSPPGALLDSDAEGKAIFGFVSKYKKGAEVPTGNTQFSFKAGDFRFKSSSYDWLVVAGAKAKFKGEGTVDDMDGTCKFMLTALDDIEDKFRIKIWNGETDVVIYDNKRGLDDDAEPTTIGGGSIVIHKN